MWESVKEWRPRNFLAVQWFRLSAFTAEGWPGPIPGWRAKILQAELGSQKKKKKKAKGKMAEEMWEELIVWWSMDVEMT